MLEEREIIITKCINEIPSIIGNRTIMNLAVQYADENKIESKTRIELLRNINMVRLYKEIILSFELVGVDGRNTTNAYWSQGEASSIKWRVMQSIITEELTQKQYK